MVTDYLILGSTFNNYFSVNYYIIPPKYLFPCHFRTLLTMLE